MWGWERESSASQSMKENEFGKLFNQAKGIISISIHFITCSALRKFRVLRIWVGWGEFTEAPS